MMNRPSWEKGDNRYAMVVQVAKRARQLVDGDEPKVKSDSQKPVSIAIQEVREGKIQYRSTKEGRA